MDPFPYQSGQAHAEGVPLAKLAEELGTPLYVYSRAALADRCHRFQEAFRSHPTLPCFAVKANGNLSVLREIFAHGLGADVVSVGEMERALAAGVKASKIVFSGVGKTDDEIRRALEAGILSFNVESAEELERLAARAKEAGKRAQVALRLNPNVDARTNPYIATGLYTTKFGIPESDVPALLTRLRAAPSLKLAGIACHIGSQITDASPFRETARRMAQMARDIQSQGFALEWIDMGGGLGIRYKDEVPPSFTAYAGVLLEEIGPTGLRLLLEPGRCLVGEAGVLLTRVVGTKRTPAKRFVIVDGAMNDLARPTLYQAYHEILPVREAAGHGEPADVVGPICETGDFLGKDRAIPGVRAGDLLFVRNCGAYASSMASHYNSRPQAPEVLVDGDSYRVVRRRETLEELWALEREAL